MPNIQETPATALTALMDEYHIKIVKMAGITKVSTTTIHNLKRGKGKITPALAFCFAKLFNTSPEYWIDLQMKVDIAKAAADPELTELLKTITSAVKPAPVKAPPSGKVTAAKGVKKDKSIKTGASPAVVEKEPAAPETAAVKTKRKPKEKKA
jgi:addiction module HigA family antidote